MRNREVTYRGPEPRPSLTRLVVMAVLYVAVLVALGWFLLSSKSK